MLNFLGTGGAFNTKRGNTSAYFELGSELFLIDVGEDVFPKTIANHLFDQKTRVNIFITHLHSDHVGSLGTLLVYLYINVFGQDRSKICVYFPSEALKDLLALQGVTEEVYTFYVNLWDELYVDGYQKEVEYNFEAGKHTSYLDYKKNENCYHITFSQKKEFCFYYSGDTCEFNHQLSNPYAYDWIYHEVTMIKSAEVHFQYDKLLEATKDMPADQKKKFVLMHLDSNFDVERAKLDGFSVAGE